MLFIVKKPTVDISEPFSYQGIPFYPFFSKYKKDHDWRFLNYSPMVALDLAGIERGSDLSNSYWHCEECNTVLICGKNFKMQYANVRVREMFDWDRMRSCDFLRGSVLIDFKTCAEMSVIDILT